WALPLFYRRYKNEVTEDESFAPLKGHESSRLGDKLEKAWQQEWSRNSNPSLWRPLWKTFYLEFLAFGSLFVFSEFALKMTQPWLIGQLMSKYTIKTTNESYIYGTLLILNSFFSVMIGHTYILKIQHLGMKVRIACCSLIYRKALKLNKTTLAETTVGKIVNLLSNDVNRFDFAPMHLFQLLVAPVETIFVIVCLCITVGPTAIAGIVFLVLFVPVQMYMGKLTSRYRSKTATKTDQRVKLMNEIIAGIQAIKMYTWEEMFVRMVKKARRLELLQVTKISYLKAFNVSCMLFMNRTGIFLCILIYAITQEKIDAKYVFVVSSFYGILRQALTVYFPLGINNFSETRVSVSRIRKFLMNNEIAEEIEIPASTEDTPLIKNSFSADISFKNNFIGVHLRNVSVKWIQSSPDYNLHNINFDASTSELVAITGSVGSGKSTLFYTILKELPCIKSEFEVGGTISYASQEPWLFSGTIRQNILFGSSFNMNKYQTIIAVCGLEEDLFSFPYRDNTLVGERGALLSGGQKARINLARAIYKDADIYLLDDPFAAVDTKVGKKIFQKCILGYLKNKCTILVTHHLHYLGKPNKIYNMDRGRLTLIETHQQPIISSDEEASNDVETKPKLLSMEKFYEKPNKVKEERKSGIISTQVYKKYVLAGGNYIIITLLVNLDQLNQIRRFFSHEICIYIYSGIILSIIILSIARSMSFFKCCMNASSKLHSNMLARIITAPMSFFNANSSGIILNRFSRDLGLIDETLPTTLMDTLQIAFVVLGSTLLIIYLNPWMIIPTLIILLIFYFYRIAFLVTSRNLKRLEAANRSPLYSHTNASLQGLTTIRSYNAQNILKKEFDHYQNFHTSAFYMFLTCNRAFGFWVDLVCVIYTVIAIVCIILMDSLVGDVGLGITQSMNLIGVFQWGIKQWSELENQMISVERVVEYTEIVSEEAEGDKQQPEKWPLDGLIKFESVDFQYSKGDPLVLNKVTFTVNPKEKIGIVGRTGAGKSSLISALFRLFSAEGIIQIDGVNIAEIPLNSLRSKMSIIPQEPTLFTGTLRQNVDPFQEFNDEKIWKVLEQVELKNAVLKLPNGLSEQIVESGSNFSVGERQLICLARAILRKNKILILDEATANVDPQTDESIQRTIRENFQNCTVLTIAHRLHTVMDSDKVLVMDGGEVAEFDHAHLLLQNSKGLFSQLVR
ncbi:multidrug resistance-associated protein, partial [Asbolus verrucosus]